VREKESDIGRYKKGRILDGIRAISHIQIYQDRKWMVYLQHWKWKTGISDEINMLILSYIREVKSKSVGKHLCLCYPQVFPNSISMRGPEHLVQILRAPLYAATQIFF